MDLEILNWRATERFFFLFCSFQLMTQLMLTEDETPRRTRLARFLKPYPPLVFTSSCIGHTSLNILSYVYNPRQPVLKHYLTHQPCTLEVPGLYHD